MQMMIRLAMKIKVKTIQMIQLMTKKMMASLDLKLKSKCLNWLH